MFYKTRTKGMWPEAPAMTWALKPIIVNSHHVRPWDPQWRSPLPAVSASKFCSYQDWNQCANLGVYCVQLEPWWETLKGHETNGLQPRIYVWNQAFPTAPYETLVLPAPVSTTTRFFPVTSTTMETLFLPRMESILQFSCYVCCPIRTMLRGHP